MQQHEVELVAGEQMAVDSPGRSRSGRAPLALVVVAIVGLGLTAATIFYQAVEHVWRETGKLNDQGQALVGMFSIEQGASTVSEFVVEQKLRLSEGAEGPIPEDQVLETGAAIDAMHAEVIGADSSDEVSDVLEGPVLELATAYIAYVNTRSATDLARLDAAAEQVERIVETSMPELDSRAAAQFDEVSQGVSRLRLLLAGLVALSIPACAGLVIWMGRRYLSANDRMRRQAESLHRANEAEVRRNAQFAGLYQVVTEVNETLNLRYIVETTVSEVAGLMDADLVVLRVLEGESLVLAGMQEREGFETPGTPRAIALGEGLVGRAARRGMTMRADGQNRLPFTETAAEVEGGAGLVVPLIVGARVVGTISCWSADDGRFGEDDIQILEMMASQVAAAIAAANLQERAEHRARHDALTELGNRRQLVDDIREQYDAAVIGNAKLAVAMIDVDHFKEFNDEHGHHAGDIALQRVAATIAATVRDQDHVYRYGGEEFVIVFGDLEIHEAREACERVRRAVAGAHVGVVSQMKVTISVGLAAVPGPYESFEELLAAADEALYVAKSTGRNRMIVAGEKRDEAA